MVQTTVYEIDRVIAKITRSLLKILPGIKKIGNKVIDCVARNYANLQRDLPRLYNLKCLVHS